MRALDGTLCRSQTDEGTAAEHEPDAVAFAVASRVDRRRVHVGETTIDYALALRPHPAGRRMPTSRESVRRARYRGRVLTKRATDCDGDLAALSLDELADELATLASHIYAGTCRWLELVAEFDRRGSWAAGGCRSCAEWLAWRCALTPRAAREHVRVARRLCELPLVHAAFARGELSYAKVRALTRVAERESEAQLLELAAALTAAQLERAVRAYRRVTAEEARELQEDEHLTAYWDEEGSLVIRGRLAPEDGALFLRALEAARERLWSGERKEERGSAEPREAPRRPTDVDALVALADAALAHDTGRSRGERYQVVVHVGERTLSGEEQGECGLEEGPAIASETARRLACDAAVVAVSEQARGRPSFGRKTRSIPAALRRTLRRRDCGCRFPGCENRFVDAHHIRHWVKGGETTLENLVLLCRVHHRCVHEGGYSVDSRMRFYDPRGRPIPAVPRPPPGGVAELVERNRALAISPETCECGDGERMDLDLAVAALVHASRG